MARGNPNWVKGRPGGRAVTIPLMGEPQPVLVAGHIERPSETPNPMDNAREPFSFPTGRARQAPTYESTTPRRVVEAEIDELLEWGLPRFQIRYPRCTVDSVKPMLVMALYSNKFCFLRTSAACGLFIAEVTPWEPELTVQDVFVVGRPRHKGEEDNAEPPALYRARVEAINICKAALRWSIDVGAVAFHYGSTTGVNIDPMADEIGYDIRNSSFTKFITPEMREAARAA